MRLRELMQSNYENRRDTDYVYTKTDDKYIPVTFGTLIENSVYLARALTELGLYGKKIIVYGENSVEWMTADLAIMAFVGINIGIDKEWKYADVRNTVDFLGASAVIYSDSKSEEVSKLFEDFPDVRFISMSGGFGGLIERGRQLSEDMGLFDFPDRTEDECIRVVFSSGTVSFPKAVMLSDKNIFSGWNSLYRRAPMDESDICYLFLPLHHTYAGIYNFLYSLISGMKIYLGTSVQNIAAELQQVNPTVFCGVPLIYRRFYEAVGGDPEKLRTAFGTRPKYLFCGGAYLDKKIRADYRNAGLNLLIAYALSETGSSFAIEYSGSKNTESVGTIYEDIDVIISDPDENGEGEICVKGDNVFIGYMNNSEATASAFNENGYFCTGDTGRIGDDRSLYLTGRKKRMILMDNGENIYPENIEKRIREKSKNISSVRVYRDNSSLKATLYLKVEDGGDYEGIIRLVNAEATKYERISAFETVIDSVDKRMKQ